MVTGVDLSHRLSPRRQQRSSEHTGWEAVAWRAYKGRSAALHSWSCQFQDGLLGKVRPRDGSCGFPLKILGGFKI